MPRLPVVTNDKMIKYLIKKGFKPHQGGRHVTFHKGNIRTQVPRHGNTELGKGLLKEILNQAGISIEEFKQDFLR